MNNLYSYLNKILFLTSVSKIDFLIILIFFMIASILDLLGIGLLSAYATLLLSPDVLLNTSFYNYLINFFPKVNILITLGFVLIIIFFIRLLISIYTYRIIFNFTHSRQKILRQKMLISYRKMSYEQYICRDSSENVASIGVYVKNYGSVINGLLIFVSDMIVAIFIATLLLFANTLILLSMILFMIIVIYIYKILFLNTFDNLGKNLNIGYQKIYQGVQEYFEGFKELYVLNKYSSLETKIIKGTDMVAESDTKQSIISAIPRFLLELSLVSFIIIIVSLTLITGNNIETVVPLLTLFAAASIRLLPMFNQISKFLSIFKYGKDSIEKLYDELKSQKTLNFFNNNLVAGKFKKLELSDISYKYPMTDNYVLKNIFFDINFGETIAITGPSGSGKTTLVDILLGLLIPQNGKILYNKSETNFENNYLRSKTAYLPQEIFLTNDTIKNNVALGEIDKNINLEKVYDSLEKAQLKDYIESQNEGINTIIGQKGISLSGGQRQRIALARSFYYDKEIIIFDESTSALDIETEKEVLSQINLLKGKKTIIFISHKKEAIEFCDKIYLIKDGNLKKA